MAELADAADLKSAGGDTVRVRPPPALQTDFSDIREWNVGYVPDEIRLFYAGRIRFDNKSLNYYEY